MGAENQEEVEDLTDAAYEHAFRIALSLLLVFAAIFFVGLLGIIYDPSSLSNPRTLNPLYPALVGGFLTVGLAFRLVQMHRLHEKFKNTGYTWPYPKDVES
jgi:hypothetical protein